MLLQGALRRDPRLKWADGRVTKEVVDEVVLKFLGPVTPADEEAAKKGRVKKPAPTTATPSGDKAKGGVSGGAGGGSTESKTTDADVSNVVLEKKNAFEGRDLASAVNSERLLAEHAKVTGGKIRTRFPPEPNGFLHIGHCKSMCLNFETAFKEVGATPDQIDVTFRYDDTNPEAESMEYIENQVCSVVLM